MEKEIISYEDLEKKVFYLELENKLLRNKVQYKDENILKFHIIFDNSTNAVFLSSVSGKIFAANPRACQLFGMSEKEICSEGTEILADPFSPGSLPENRIREKDGFFLGQMTFKRKNNTTFSCECINKIFHESPQSKLQSVTIREISEIIDNSLDWGTSDRFKSLFERHKAIMLITDPDTGRVVDANNSASEFYGYSRDEFRKMTIFDVNIWPPERIVGVINKAAEEKQNYFVVPLFV